MSAAWAMFTFVIACVIGFAFYLIHKVKKSKGQQ